MSNWRVKMPRESPPRGQVHSVYAAKSGGGWRTEISGVISQRKSELIVALLNLPEDAVDPFALALGVKLDNKK